MPGKSDSDTEPDHTGQVLGESAAIGVAGAAAGTGLGFAGAAIIAAVAPALYATADANSLPRAAVPGSNRLLVGARR